MAATKPQISQTWALSYPESYPASIKLYLKDGLTKVEVAVGKGKKLHDKRESEREREMKDEARAGVRRSAKKFADEKA
jgi:tmRNA-binding protein